MVMTVGQQIKSIRVTQGLSQLDLAERIGVTQSAVSKIESHSVVSLTLLGVIAAVLGKKLVIDLI